MSLAIMLKLLQTIKELRQLKKWTLAQLEAFQQNELRGLRAHAYAHSPFYQRFHQGLFDRPPFPDGHTPGAG